MAEEQGNILPLEEQENQSFNWRLFLTIGWINRWWIVAYVFVGFLSAFLYLRYATPLYQSQAAIQFKDRTQQNTVDLGILVSSPNVDRLNEEMTILKSKGYKLETLKNLPLSISYYLKERLKSGEIYDECPFIVTATIIDSSITGVPIYLKIVDSTHYTIQYDRDDKQSEYTFEFGKPFNTDAFNISVALNTIDERNFKNNYYFTINDITKIAKQIEGKINIEVDNLYGGKIVVNYSDPNKNKARDVVNIIAAQIVDLSLERKARSASLVINFIQAQIDTLEKQLNEQENVLKNFKKQNQIISPGTAETNIIQKLNDIDQGQLEVMLEDKSLAWLEDFTNNKNNDLDALSSYFGDLKYNDFSPYLNSLTELQNQREQFGLSITDTDPRLVSVNRQIAEVKKNFKGAIVNAKAKLAVRKNYLDSEESKYEKEFLALPEKESEFARLTRLNDIKEKYYLLLLQKQSEYEITLAGMTSDYIILDPAESGGLIAPVRAKIWGICLLLGVGISFAHVYIRFLLHSTIIGVPDVEKATSVPLLGVLPQYTKTKIDTPQIVVNSNPKSHIAEAFRSVRSNMQYFLRDNTKNHLIAITSTVSGEGKTFIALNLAHVLSSLGKKVVIVDFDLRKPKIHKAFNLKNDIGVSTILINRNTIQECTTMLPDGSLHIITSGPVPPNPAELIVSKAADQMLQDLVSIYDFVIIDNPPVGIVSDSIPVLSKVSLSIYVIRANYSKRTFINNINRLYFDNNLKNLAIVVNDADASGTSYGYGYGSGYGYGYAGYNDYYDEDSSQTSFIKRFFGLKK